MTPSSACLAWWGTHVCPNDTSHTVCHGHLHHTCAPALAVPGSLRPSRSWARSASQLCDQGRRATDHTVILQGFLFFPSIKKKKKIVYFAAGNRPGVKTLPGAGGAPHRTPGLGFWLTLTQRPGRQLWQPESPRRETQTGLPALLRLGPYLAPGGVPGLPRGGSQLPPEGIPTSPRWHPHFHLAQPQLLEVFGA